MAEIFDKPLWIFAYAAVAFALAFCTHHRLGRVLFAWLNVGAIFLIFFTSDGSLEAKSLCFATYFALVLFQFVATRVFCAFRGWPSLLPVWLPIAMLISLRVGSVFTLADYSVWFGSWIVPIIARSGIYQSYVFAGFSYVAFRMCLLALEVRQDPRLRPSLHSFIGYVFFLPHFLVGPISTYRSFADSLRGEVARSTRSLYDAGLRILVGLVKFYFLGGLVYQLTFTRSFTEQMTLTVWQALVSVFAYSGYIYLNFSGFCDVMIGLAGLLGFESQENFDRPLAATNLRSFWRRWHATLGQFLQVMIFNPTVRTGARIWGPRAVPHLAALGTLMVFVGMGLWHGFRWNYMIFALLHAAGLIVYHYMTLAKMKRFKLPTFFAWLLTFTYVTFCFFFFENDLGRAAQIVRAIRF